MPSFSDILAEIRRMVWKTVLAWRWTEPRIIPMKKHMPVLLHCFFTFDKINLCDHLKN